MKSFSSFSVLSLIHKSRTLRPSFLVFALGAVLQAADAPTMGKGTHFDTLIVGKKTYTNVDVRQVTVHSIFFSDTEGFASIPLRELSPSLQLAFGYNANLENAEDVRLEAVRRHAGQQLAERRAASQSQLSAAVSSKFKRLEASFAHPPFIQPQVDLRPRFRELALGIKNQGQRPSCAVFAVVSAYEFQDAELLGKSEKLSEDYLIWATRTVELHLPKNSSSEPASDIEPGEGKDIGFSLGLVVATLRGFGLAPQSAMPNTFTKFADIPAPSDELIKESSHRRKLTVHDIKGGDNVTRLGNIIQALNEEVPVPIGLRWPHPRTVRNGYLDQQSPIENSLHAVTIVGYICPNQEIEDTVFLFKNSYGPNWGEAGYGRATYRYLSENLLDAVVFEVQRPDSPAALPLAK